MLSTREHVDLMAMFEREEKGARLTKEPKTLWRIGVIYQDGEVNARFLAYRRGYAFGKTVDSARSPDREAGSGTAAEALGKFVDEMQTNTIPAIVDMQRRRAELAIASRNRILTSSNVEELREHLRNANAYIEQLEASSHPVPSEGTS